MGSGPARTLADSDKPILMLTGFEPFGGAPQNNSWRVVSQLAESPQLKAIFDVRTCLLPVDYDHGAEVALQCLHALPRTPVAVVSFGEADCKTQLERRYVNQDNTSIPDNAGVLRQGSKIIESGPAELGPTLSIEQMMAALPAGDSGKVIFSDDAGQYVCNNTAYWMADSLMPQGDGSSRPKTGFAFIHVPNASARCRADSDPLMLARMLTPMLIAGVPHPITSSRSNVASGGVLPFSN